ncbi:HD domain-containing protein [Desulfonatronovibrio hydrogenovorans]|uniref:HD domain-containing protein n=1 Tax=Desulfonatronovibrio hydrogenovorans TaxID=53245 RepID=UPI00068E484F|nr:HD domain-containing protein [Desulfonatronovibrio hydrogenovorans]
MHDKLVRVRNKAGMIARQCNLEFYSQFSSEYALSRDIFFSHPMILRLREDVLPFLNDGFGHGIEHSKKVAIDAGMLAIIETRAWEKPAESKKTCILAQMCGLLHDVCRQDEDHARKGAEFSLLILNNYPLSSKDKEDIAFAVSNHEAFKDAERADSQRQQILSDVLYDADKFRWGPDNFITTLWEICCFEEWSLEEIIERFPKGLKFIESVGETFRTETGRMYGPEFIKCGLEVGSKVYRLLREDCGPDLEAGCRLD